MVSSNCLLVSFISDTCALIASASAFLPSFISPPICAAIFLASLRFLSNCCWASRRFLSTAKTSSIASLAPLKCFFSKPRITRSVSSVMSFSVSIILMYFEFCLQNYKKIIRKVRLLLRKSHLININCSFCAKYGLTQYPEPSWHWQPS